MEMESHLFVASMLSEAVRASGTDLVGLNNAGEHMEIANFNEFIRRKQRT